jgi:DNA polymerase-3 subunit beta
MAQVDSKLEIIIETKELVHALTFANSIVEKRNIINELNNIKLSVEGGSLELIATDMDIMLSQKIGANVASLGETTVSTVLLADITRRIPDKEIRLKQHAENEELEITGRNCNFNLLTLPVAQFPVMENIKAETNLKISCKSFARIIDYTQFSMSTEETRYNLNGIYLHVKEQEVRAAATDGHRLSVAAEAIGENIAEFGVIIPRKAVQEIAKIVKDSKNASADIEISLSVNKIKFACNNLVMISKLIDGTFPDYAGFIPANNPNKFVISTKMLADAIERVATVTVDKFRAIKLSLTSACVEITASGEARGAAKEVLNASNDQDNPCTYSGAEELTIGFNPKYLLDVLGTIKSSKIEIHFNDSFSPVLIKAVDSPSDNFVIMPVKV